MKFDRMTILRGNARHAERRSNVIERAITALGILLPERAVPRSWEKGAGQHLPAPLDGPEENHSAVTVQHLPDRILGAQGDAVVPVETVRGPRPDHLPAFGGRRRDKKDIPADWSGAKHGDTTERPAGPAWEGSSRRESARRARAGSAGRRDVVVCGEKKKSCVTEAVPLTMDRGASGTTTSWARKRSSWFRTSLVREPRSWLEISGRTSS